MRTCCVLSFLLLLLLTRRSFLKMCNCPEAFLSLRSHFISSHALLCVSHWILGIGDRHLSNFMIDTETGGMVGIDFGHAFGSATQVRFVNTQRLSLRSGVEQRNPSCVCGVLPVPGGS